MFLPFQNDVAILSMVVPELNNGVLQHNSVLTSLTAELTRVRRELKNDIALLEEELNSKRSTATNQDRFEVIGLRYFILSISLAYALALIVSTFLFVTY